jgi:hypothetical protein
LEVLVRQTRKLESLLELIRAGKGERGIYALAAAAGRPYRRVHAQVQRLAEAGLVTLDAQTSGRAVTRVRAVNEVREPSFSFNRAWSRPSGGQAPEAVIAQVLARPAFEDLLACVDHYGLSRVRRVHTDMLRRLELRPGAAQACQRMLNNIEIGRARAA